MSNTDHASGREGGFENAGIGTGSVGGTQPLPASGEAIAQDRQLVPIAALAWHFTGADGATVTLIVGDQRYTFSL